MTIYTGHPGVDDNFPGTAGPDIFRFDVLDLTAADILTGGAGADRLVLTTAGTLTGARLAGLSSIETILLFNGGTNSIGLRDSLVTSAGGLLTILCGRGNDTVNGAPVSTATNRLDISAGGGDDTLTGGAGDDVFRFSLARLTFADKVTGRGGMDTLALTGAGTLDFTALQDIGQIERVTLDDNAHTVVFSNTQVSSAAGKTITLTSGSGVDVVNASIVANFLSGSLVLNLGGGADQLDVGHNGSGKSGDLGEGDDQLTIQSDSVSPTFEGGAGVDTLVVDNYFDLSFLMGAGLTGFERVLLVDTTNPPNSGDYLGFTANDTAGLVVTGMRTDEAYTIVLGAGGQTAIGNDSADTLVGGSGQDVLTGGGGDDIITAGNGGSTIRGGLGLDTQTGGNGTDIFVVFGAELVAGEVMDGGGGYDGLTAHGTLDFTSVAVANIEEMDLAAGAKVTLSMAQVNALWHIVSLTTGVVETLTINNVDHLDLTPGGLYGFEATDRLLINATANNDTFVDAGLMRATVHGLGGDDLIDQAASWAAGSQVFGEAGLDFVSYGATSSAAVIDGGDDDDTLVLGFNSGATAVLGVPGLTIDLSVAPGQDQTTGDTTVVKNFENVFWSRGSSDVTILGGNGDNSLSGGSGADVIKGRGGRDIVSGGGGHDDLDGGGDDDTVVYRGGELSVSGGAGHDMLLLSGSPGPLTINLSAADQTTGDTVDVKLFEGVNASQASAKVDMIGTSGFEQLIGSAFGEQIQGMGGDDSITGRGGADVLKGGAGSDQFLIYAGDFAAGESINGGADFDILSVINAVADFRTGQLAALERLDIFGGGAIITGAQAAQFSAFSALTSSAETLQIDFGAGSTGLILAASQLLQFQGGDRVLLNGASSAETFRVEALATLHGGGGSDVLYSSTAAGGWVGGSEAYGDGGDDRIDYGTGTLGLFAPPIVLDGGTGRDTLFVSFGTFTAVTLDLSNADDQQVGGYAVVRGFENVDWSGGGSGFALNVTGSSGANVLIGGHGADTINGGGGSDVLSGGNTVSGTDQLTGGAGADTFVLGAGFGNAPIITDLVSGEDRLQFAAADYDTGGDAFDTRIFTSDVGFDLTGADLIIYTGGSLSDEVVRAYLDNSVGYSGEAAFFLTSTGDLFYTTASSVQEVAHLNVGTLSVDDFTFV